MAVPDELRTLTLHEVAASLGVTYDTARNRACLGLIPGAFQVGRWWRVHYLDFKKWLDLGCPKYRRW